MYSELNLISAYSQKIQFFASVINGFSLRSLYTFVVSLIRDTVMRIAIHIKESVVHNFDKNAQFGNFMPQNAAKKTEIQLLPVFNFLLL